MRFVKCARVTDVGLSHLSTHCGNILQSIWLEEMLNITRAGIDAFRNQCPTAALQYAEKCWTVPGLERALSNKKTTIMKVVLRVTDSTAQSLVSSSDSVRIVVLYSIDKSSLSTEGLTALCRKMPQLHTVVCSKHILDCVRELVSALPHIRVTTDLAVCDVDVMELPV